MNVIDLESVRIKITNELKTNRIFNRCEVVGDRTDLIAIKIYNHSLEDIDDVELNKFLDDCINQIELSINKYSKEFKYAMTCDDKFLSIYVYINNRLVV